MANTDVMSLEDTLLAFGEWLDSRCECYNPEHDHDTDIEETHQDVAVSFIHEWESVEGRATLAGRALPKIGAALSELADGLKEALDEAADTLRDKS